MTNIIVKMIITRVLYIVNAVCSRLFIDLFLLCVYHLSLCVIIICNTKIGMNNCLSYVYPVYCSNQTK